MKNKDPFCELQKQQVQSTGAWGSREFLSWREKQCWIQGQVLGPLMQRNQKESMEGGMVSHWYPTGLKGCQSDDPWKKG